MEIQDLFKQADFQFILKILEEKLKKHIGDDIEIESRLGTIIDVFTNERLRITAAHPIVLEQFHDFRFKSGIPENDFHKFKETFQNEKSVKTNDTVIFYKEFRKITCDGESSIMKKRRIAVFDIYMPKNAYDLRIAVSRETPVAFNFRKGTFSRERERESFEKNNLRFDFTETRSEQKKQFEVETEMISSDGNLTDFLNVSLNTAFFYN